jgi:hypothetical protein
LHNKFIDSLSIENAGNDAVLELATAATTEHVWADTYHQ